MLNLTESSRRFLTAVGGLSLDESGDEILIGLTVSESDFYLKYRDDPREPLSKTRQYYRLMELHLVARQLKLGPRKY